MKSAAPSFRWLRSLADVRPEERLPVALLFCYGFLVLASFYILKPVRNSVFVDRVGADQLPVVYILTAAAMAVAMLLYGRLTGKRRESAVAVGTLVALAISLVAFRWWLGRGESLWSAGAFYVWGKLFPVLLVSQFYLTANLVFTTRQAHRLFAVIGLGLILGGMAGSALAGTAASALGTGNLLLVSAGLLLLCAGPVLALRPDADGAAGGDGGSEPSGDPWRMLRESSHLRTLALILGLTTVVGTLVDWQFNSAVEAFVPGEDAKTAFYGRFFFLLNVGSVAVQALLTGLVLRRLGIGAAMLILPLSLLAGGVAVLVVPALLSAALIKGVEGSLRFSLDQSTRELLYLPVPTEAKVRTKPAIDLAVYRGGTGLAGILLLLVVALPGLEWEGTMRVAAALTAAAALAWALATRRMAREFRDSLRRLIGVRDVDLDEVIVQRLDSGTLEDVHRALRSDVEEETLFALGLLERHPEGASPAEVASVVDHRSAEVRRRAIALLRELEAVEHADTVRRHLKDEALEVRMEAVRYVCEVERPEAGRRMDAFLQDEDVRIRIAATACILRYGGPGRTDAAGEMVAELAAAGNADTRMRAAELLGSAGRMDDRGRAALIRLLEDADPTVRERAMLAAGETRLREAVPLLLRGLASPGDRRGALRGLRAYGTDVHPVLLDALVDPDTSPEARLAIPRALVGEDTTQRSVDALVGFLEDLEPAARFEALRALNRLRGRREDLRFDGFDLDRLVEREVGEAYRWVVHRAALEGRPEDPADDPGQGLLLSTLRQRTLEAAERASRLLGLQHPMEDLYAAFTALESSDPVRMEQGFELLDSTLPRRYRDMVHPLLDPDTPLPETAEEARERYGLAEIEAGESLRRLAAGGDPWVAVLAARAGGLPLDPASAEAAMPRLRARPTPAAEPTDDEERPVTTPTAEAPPLMDIVDRAELLQRTDLFRHLRTEDLGGIATLVRERDLEEGETVFEEGGVARDLYIVVSGRLAARRGDTTLFTAEPGQTVGDLSLLDGEPQGYSAEALEPTRVLVLAREDFHDLLTERFRVVRGVLAHLAGVVRRQNERLGGDESAPPDAGERGAADRGDGDRAGEPGPASPEGDPGVSA